jgi:hypothetical protein
MTLVKGAEFEFSSWLNYDNPEEVVIVDPYDGTPVVDALPRPISEHYQNGIDAVSSVPSSIEIALGAHVKSSDLDAQDNDKWFEETLQNPVLDAYFYEGFGVRPWSQVLKRIDGYALHILPWPRNGFTERQNYALARSGIHAAPIDFRKSDKLATSLDKSLRNEVYKESSRGTLAALAVSQFVREWAMVSNIGHSLVKMDAKNNSHPESPLKIMMTVGAAHRNISQKLREYGVVTSTKDLTKDDERGWITENLPLILSTGKITEEQFASAEEDSAN